MIPIAKVIQSVSFYHCYGQDYNLQNLQWSQKILSACCLDELCNQINKKLLKSWSYNRVSQPSSGTPSKLLQP